MSKEMYNTKLIRKQFKGMSKIMAAILREKAKDVEGPIRIALTDDEGNQTMTLTLARPEK